jgi:hypothetical protein
MKYIEMGVCPPHHKPSKARTVEDGIRAVGQAHARLGSPDPRRDAHGGIYFHIQHQTKAYKKDAAPLPRVKPVSIIIIIIIMAQAFGDKLDDMIIVTFFSLLPGEYTRTLSYDAAFKIEDFSLYVQGCKLDFDTASDAEIKASTSASYTFMIKKNNNCNEKVVQGLSDDPWFCPVKATI